MLLTLTVVVTRATLLVVVIISAVLTVLCTPANICVLFKSKLTIKGIIFT